MKKNRSFYFALLMSIALMSVAIFAPVLAPFDPQYIDITNKLQLPDGVHYLGTDHLGRDVLSRLIYGTRLSIFISASITILTLLISFPIGLLVGWFGGRVEKFFSWFASIVMAFPSFLLSMAFAGILGEGVDNIVLAVTMVEWVYYARILRNMVFTVKNNEYVLVARSMGASPFYIIRRHILPFVFRPILIIALMNIGSIILMISGFSFLGIGVQPNISEWGMMLNDAKSYYRSIPGLVLYPGLAIFVTVLTFNLLGENFDKKGSKKLWEN
ncbi:MAG: ABC transporter permease subunit [Peptostreptococcaceae bacterium]|nr:ABC transporter permease subunit [Peptostreptococcaceae bacterium]